MAQDSLRLRDAIEIGLAQNYSIKIAAEDIKIADFNHSRGHAGMLPSLDVNAQASKSGSNTRQEFVTGNLVDKTGALATQYQSEIALSWTLFDGMRMFITYDKLKLLKTQSEQMLKVRIEEFVFQITNQYALIAKQQLALRSYSQLLKLAEEQLEWTRKKFEIEQTGKSDLLQSEIEWNRQKANLLIRENEIKNAKRQLNLLLSRNPETGFFVMEDEGLLLNPLQDFDPTQWIQKNLNLKILESDKKIAEFELKELKTGYYPQLFLNSSYSYNKTENQAGFLLFNRNHGWNVNLNASWNLFNGHRLKKDIAISKINILKSNLAIESLKLENETQLRDAYNRYLHSKEIAALEEKNLQLIQAYLDLVSSNYQLGEALFLEWKEARSQFESSLNQLLEYKYQAKLAELEYRRLSGILIN